MWRERANEFHSLTLLEDRADDWSDSFGFTFALLTGSLSAWPATLPDLSSIAITFLTLSTTTPTTDDEELKLHPCGCVRSLPLHACALGAAKAGSFGGISHFWRERGLKKREDY